jgi:hypothetical protein
MMEFLLEKWNYIGERTLRVEHQDNGWYREANARHKQMTSSALGPRWVHSSRAANLIWIIYLVQERTRSVSRSGATTDSAVAASMDAVVEAVDTQTWQTRAVLRLPRTFVAPVFGSPDEIMVFSHRGSDVFEVSLSRLSVRS